MKAACITALFAFALAISASAQTAAEKKAVMKPVDDLFLGMKKGDSALVHSAFTKQVTFISIGRDKAGKPKMDIDKLQDFLVAVGSPHTETWNELIWDTEIRIDGDFAQVYAKFGFFLGTKFSHCGIDAFHLFRGEDGKWKIFNLSDTRQREGCMVPPAVAAQLN